MITQDMGVLIMYKKLVKSIIICVSVVFFTLMIGYITYFATVNVINRSVTKNLNSAEAVASQTTPGMQEAIPSSTPGNEQYYLARLNGNSIEIYLCSNTDSAKAAEKFLYSFKVYALDIPDDDILNLTRGIIFKTKEELASFEEDYNS